MYQVSLTIFLYFPKNAQDLSGLGEWNSPGIKAHACIHPLPF